MRSAGVGSSLRTFAQVEVQPHRCRHVRIVVRQRPCDAQIGQTVAVDVLDTDQIEALRFLVQLDGQVGLARVAATRLAAMDRHGRAASEVDEVLAPVAVEVAGKLGEAAELQVVQIELQLSPTDRDRAPARNCRPAAGRRHGSRRRSRSVWW